MLKLVVLFCVLAMSAGAVIVPWTPFAPVLASNYRGPLSLAPGQPANILAADGRPLDTLDVNLDRSAHYVAKAFTGTGLHLLKKRSASLIAPIAVAPARLLAHAPLAYTTHVAAAPIVHTPFIHW